MDKEDRETFQKIAVSSRQVLNSKSTSGTVGPILSTTMEAAQAATRLFACYRKDEANNPEVFITAVAAVFGRYPLWIVKAVSDPINGIPSQIKWLPSISEVRSACDALNGYDIRQKERDESLAKQRAESAEYKARQEAPRPTYDELKAKYGPNWGLQDHQEDLVARRRHLSEINRANRIGLKKVREIYGGEYNEWASPMLVEKMRNLKHQ